MNAWSMLYDELNMDEQYTATGEKWVKDIGGYEWTPVGGPTGTERYPAAQEIKMSDPRSIYKYDEDKVLQEIQDYITDTYRAHYASGGIQTLDLIDSCGDAAAFCRSNILKYASRYDKKGCAKMDIKKIIHYAVLLYHFTNRDQITDARGYETF